MHARPGSLATEQSYHLAKQGCKTELIPLIGFRETGIMLIISIQTLLLYYEWLNRTKTLAEIGYE